MTEVYNAPAIFPPHLASPDRGEVKVRELLLLLTKIQNIKQPPIRLISDIQEYIKTYCRPYLFNAQLI